MQEEPRNMGARAHMSPRILQVLPDGLRFGYIGRPERASPGEGYPVAHVEEQSRIVRTALNCALPVSQFPRKPPGASASAAAQSASRIALAVGATSGVRRSSSSRQRGLRSIAWRTSGTPSGTPPARPAQNSSSSDPGASAAASR